MIDKNSDIVICKAFRSPFNDYSDNENIDKASDLIHEILKSVSIPFESIGEFLVTTNLPISEFPQSSFKKRAGLIAETPGIFLTGKGTSAFQSLKIAAMLLKQGEIDGALAAGISCTTNQISGQNLFITYCDHACIKYGIDRLQQDEWTYRSFYKYRQSFQSGKFNEELFAGNIDKSRKIEFDKTFTLDVSLELLTNLLPYPGLEFITSGNTAIVSAGSAAVLLNTRQQAADMGIQPLATLVASSSVATDPDSIAEAQAMAIQMVCKKANLSIEDMAVININEDFACLPLTSLKYLSGDDLNLFNALFNKTNINGGAIACGNPPYASGFKILLDAIYELRRIGSGFGLCTICDGNSQAEACIIRV